ncbi:MAG: MBL fold metallo-hydrolase [Actinobacteria bacterium]|nr:MBL fold metallo-hydrolase [Actinomycetota bacterium]
MSGLTRKRELGRGERVLPGIWRLRLPLPWPGIPHCNAWAIAAGDGIVLVDTGLHEPGSMAHLDRALAMVNLRIENVKLLVCTHAHADHYGQAATILERVECELWMHPNHAHMIEAAQNPQATLDRRLEIARQSGVPEAPQRAYEQASKGQGSGIAAVVAPDRDLVAGVEIQTDLGPWKILETPGHAPSHVCLYQEERRILISGDHLVGRISPYYDYGWTADPAGEFLESLSAVEDLDMRLCLAGHARPFTDVQAHINANRVLVAERLEACVTMLATADPVTVFEAIPLVYGPEITRENAGWWLNETLCYLRHLELAGVAACLRDDPSQAARWTLA